MYETHFGLKSRPFGSKAEGNGVFVGPQQAQIITNLKKGLAAQDAVVTVTGPVGAGKTTIVSRALDTISPNRMAAWVGRMQLAHDEVLELLLAGFGIRPKSKGAMQRFATFRRLLAEKAAVGAQVAIIIEDAHRIGVDALVELEALTAADTGDGTGGNIILMGQPGLHALLAKPELVRMKQRNRLRQNIEPFSQAEVTGYLKHSIRESGGDYDAVFGQGVAEIVFACSEGIPRIINTLCEAALTTAAAEKSPTVTATLMHKVAVDAYGFEGPVPAATATTEIAGDPCPTKDMPAESAVAQDSLTGLASATARHRALPAVSESAEQEPATASKAAGASVEPAAHRSPASPSRTPDSSPIVHAVEENLADKDLPESARNVVVESGRYPEPLPEATPVQPSITADVDSTDGVDSEPVRIPELINDTQPELNTLKIPEEVHHPAPRSGLEHAQAIDNQVGSAATRNEMAHDEARETGAEPADEDDESFDLDAVLSIDVEETNVMKGLTPNLDEIANAQQSPPKEAEAKPQGTATKSPPANNELLALDELPTLSDSMRVDVKKEVKRAQQVVDAAPEAQPTSDAAATAKPDTAAQPHPNSAATSPAMPDTATQAQQPAAEAKAPAKPDPATQPHPIPSATSPAKPDTATQVQQPAAEAKAPAKPDAAPHAPATPAAKAPATPDTAARAQPAPEAKAPAKPNAQPASAAMAPTPAKAAPVTPSPAQADRISEMTARIAAISPDSRKDGVDALEAALDAARKADLGALQAASVSRAGNGTASAPATATEMVDLPEIILDDVLPKKALDDAALKKAADEIGSASSLEDISDAMAETLFGNEAFDKIAAEVVANPPDHYEKAEAPPAGPSPVKIDESVLLSAAEESGKPIKELQLEEAAVDDAAEELPASNDPGETPLRNSMALRIDMLQAMKNSGNQRPSENIELSSHSREVEPRKRPGPQPEPIENQINTSITQTLEALKVDKMPHDSVAAKSSAKSTDKKPGGLFSRFRKSS